jgi:uncharacterized membrane protein YhhN
MLWPALAIGLALIEIFAVYRNSQRLEFLAKPAVMVALFLWLGLTAGLSGPTFWFGLGLLFSLVGDVLLIRHERFFLAALVFFLLAHLTYLAGFSFLLPALSTWGLLMAVVLGLSAARLMRRVLAGVHASGQSALRWPVVIYGSVLTLMLLSGLLTLSNPAWDALASVLVALGAASFFLSDNLLGWNKFVAPLPRGRFLNIIPYELGQILIIAGVIRQFA